MDKVLYTDHTGIRSFSGEVLQSKKENLVLIDEVDVSTITSDVPVGINMFLMRSMEGYLDIPTLHVRAKRM